MLLGILQSTNEGQKIQRKIINVLVETRFNLKVNDARSFLALLIKQKRVWPEEFRPVWALINNQLEPEQTSWAIDSEAIRARGIIVLVKSNLLVKKVIARLYPFLPPKHYKYGGRFSLVVGYNIQPRSSSTNQNAVLVKDHQLDFTNI